MLSSPFEGAYFINTSNETSYMPDVLAYYFAKLGILEIGKQLGNANPGIGSLRY